MRSPNNYREEVQKKELDFYVYNLILKGYSPSHIVINTSMSKQKVDYYISKLKALKLVSKVAYGVWKVEKELSYNNFQKFKKVQKKQKSEHFSLGTSGGARTNLHALQIKIPILSGKIKDSNWETREKLKNWIPKYTKLRELGGLQIKNNNNKSIIVWAKEREVQELSEVNKLTHAILIYLGAYFKTKYNVVLDTINADVKNLDLATEDKNAESMRKKGEKFLLNLNKPCEKILKNDKDKPAKAWIDGSPYKFSAETNDLEWKREYLNMPFNIKHLMSSMFLISEYNENLKLHLEVQREQLQTQKMLQKLIESKLN